jgi:hypothetical protein
MDTAFEIFPTEPRSVTRSTPTDPPEGFYVATVISLAQTIAARDPQARADAQEIVRLMRMFWRHHNDQYDQAADERGGA